MDHVVMECTGQLVSKVDWKLEETTRGAVLHKGSFLSEKPEAGWTLEKQFFRVVEARILL